MSAAAAASSSRRTPVHVHPSFDSPRVLTLTISRPPVNAFDTALWRELRAAFHEVETLGREVRAIVLVSDVDSGFTAGLDRTCTLSFWRPPGPRD
jgi:enoyl-CoA hydratase/carnithine racemase